MTAVPVLVLEFPERRDASHDAGVVDQDVDAPERLERVRTSSSASAERLTSPPNPTAR